MPHRVFSWSYSIVKSLECFWKSHEKELDHKTNSKCKSTVNNKPSPLLLLLSFCHKSLLTLNSTQPTLTALSVDGGPQVFFCFFFQCFELFFSAFQEKKGSIRTLMSWRRVRASTGSWQSASSSMLRQPSYMMARQVREKIWKLASIYTTCWKG